MSDAVVLLHPFPFDSRIWDEVAFWIEKSNWNVVTPDFRGCGLRTLGNEPPSLELLARDVWDELDEREIDQPLIIGISLGGYVAQEMLRQRPQGVLALGLVDTKASADDETAKSNRERLALQMEHRGGLDNYATNALTSMLGTVTHDERPDIVEHVREWIMQARPESVAWLLRAMAARPDSFDVLRGFEGPSLLLRGSDDQVSSQEDFNRMQEVLPYAIYKEIPNVGHLPPIEAPYDTGQAILGWLAQIRPVCYFV